MSKENAYLAYPENWIDIPFVVAVVPFGSHAEEIEKKFKEGVPQWARIKAIMETVYFHEILEQHGIFVRKISIPIGCNTSNFVKGKEMTHGR